ncbi:SIMPL domain-containing protein [Photobacterium sp. OFAV2-7]|uniref:SIMPL domain-containing protein n=1 Tax=Photobacterium sp. OFAV2-7 TaxID=2917748 RepID=UPI001EF62ACC|nr:SIMPL domain-containing protein [Photobacterium sp. OFAV2-7]MCG7588647.1 SIMPL domain-containing protein [Photobacterium sp. OFAV2-7]
MNKQILGIVLGGVLIALGLGSCGYFIGQTMYNAKVAMNIAEVKGLAEQRVESDIANWQLRFSISSKNKQDIPALYQQAEAQQQEIIAILKANGFTDDEIEIGLIEYKYYEYRDDGQTVVDQDHELEGMISLETTKVRDVATVRGEVNKLVAKGYNITNYAPTYRFTKLNDIKPEMLKAATTNARIAANEFAANAGVAVGGIRSARQGNFSITDAGEEYGDRHKIEKDVRVVTRIEFYLTE